MSPAVRRPPADAPAHQQAEPSWGRVLATTIELWLARQRRAAGFARRSAGPARRWRLAALILVLAIVAVVIPLGTGVFARTAPRPARVRSPGAASAQGPSSAAATAARAAAATWIAGQVSRAAIVGCYPAMCDALQAHGVTAGRLMPFAPRSARPPGADVVVTSAASGRRFAAQYAPALIASFGAGGARIEVSAIARGGAAAYGAAARSDLAARESAGAQLLQNSRIRFSSPEAAQLRRGEVDSRVLSTLAALSAQYRFLVTAFGDASPGAPSLFRGVTIASSGGKRPVRAAAARALVNAQDPPYRPDLAAILRSAGGRAALRVEFPAPSPLGLLATVLTVEH